MSTSILPLNGFGTGEPPASGQIDLRRAANVEAAEIHNDPRRTNIADQVWTVSARPPEPTAEGLLGLPLVANGGVNRRLDSHAIREPAAPKQVEGRRADRG